MSRSLDRAWWTAFGFFVAAVAISSGLTLYRAYLEELRYREMFSLYVMPRPLPPPAPSLGDPVVRRTPAPFAI